MTRTPAFPGQIPGPADRPGRAAAEGARREAAAADAETDDRSGVTAETETEAGVEAETEDESADRTDTAADEGALPADGAGASDDASGGEPPTDETVPKVELGLYQISVTVQGKSTDDLDAVETTAEGLLDTLVERAEALEESPDDRGLG